jgi:hypothetical protein
VWVEHGENERSASYVGGDRRKGTSCMTLSARLGEVSTSSRTIWRKLHPGLDSNGSLR